MKTVLIADDQPGIRHLVSATIGTDLCAIVEAADGDEAWDLVRRHRPVVAILDVQMPGRSGLEVARAIKADPDLAAIRVIMLTAMAQEHDRAAGKAAGADDYLAKPFSPLQLVASVEAALG
jgi:CheY-like chemotaxis protein